MAKKTSKVKIAAEVGAGLAAAAIAGYYFYGSKRAKKHRAVVANELKQDWKLMQNELQQISGESLSRAKVAGKRVLASGKKVAKSASQRIVKKIVRKVRKSR